MSGVRYLLCLVWCGVAISGELAAAQTPPGNSRLCQVTLEGHSIKSLTLVRMADVNNVATNGISGQKFDRPGKRLLLLPGRYRVELVELEGGIESRPGRSDGDWLVVESGKPCQLVVGAPLAPDVTVRRHGKYLEMDYQLVDGAGRQYRQAPIATNTLATSQLSVPQFRVYKDGALLGSEAFQYG